MATRAPAARRNTWVGRGSVPGAPLETGEPLASFDVYNTLQGFAQLGLLGLALGLTMIAGEFDLSVVGTYALGGMLAVRTGEQSAVLGVLVAMAAGALIGAGQGILVGVLRIPSMPVTLATYIALLGLTYALSGGLSVSYPTSRPRSGSTTQSPESSPHEA